MATLTASTVLKTGTRVRATVDMKGVPLGTEGKVIHVQGLSWIRYWVWFDNGIRLGTIDRAKLATAEDWERSLIVGSQVAVVESEVAATVGEAAADGAGESVGGVPALLLERSRKARERAAAKKAG